MDGQMYRWINNVALAHPYHAGQSYSEFGLIQQWLRISPSLFFKKGGDNYVDTPFYLKL